MNITMTYKGHKPEDGVDLQVTQYDYTQIITTDSSHTAEHDKEFWSLVGDEQIELLTKKEPKPLPKKSKTVIPYSTVYTPPSQHIFDLKEPTKMTVRPEVHQLPRSRKSTFTQLGGGETPSEFRARKLAKKLARK